MFCCHGDWVELITRLVGLEIDSYPLNLIVCRLFDRLYFISFQHWDGWSSKAQGNEREEQSFTSSDQNETLPEGPRSDQLRPEITSEILEIGSR